MIQFILGFACGLLAFYLVATFLSATPETITSGESSVSDRWTDTSE